jgi:hypothetical protein
MTNAIPGGRHCNSFGQNKAKSRILAIIDEKKEKSSRRMRKFEFELPQTSRYLGQSLTARFGRPFNARCTNPMS